MVCSSNSTSTTQTVANFYMIYQNRFISLTISFFLLMTRWEDGDFSLLVCVIYDGEKGSEYWWLLWTLLYFCQISMNAQMIHIIVMSMVSAPIQMARFIARAKWVIPAMESTAQVTRTYQSCTKYFANWFKSNQQFIDTPLMGLFSDNTREVNLLSSFPCC